MASHDCPRDPSAFLRNEVRAEWKRLTAEGYSESSVFRRLSLKYHPDRNNGKKEGMVFLGRLHEETDQEVLCMERIPECFHPFCHPRFIQGYHVTMREIIAFLKTFLKQHLDIEADIKIVFSSAKNLRDAPCYMQDFFRYKLACKNMVVKADGGSSNRTLELTCFVRLQDRIIMTKNYLGNLEDELLDSFKYVLEERRMKEYWREQFRLREERKAKKEERLKKKKTRKRKSKPEKKKRTSRPKPKNKKPRRVIVIDSSEDDAASDIVEVKKNIDLEAYTKWLTTKKSSKTVRGYYNAFIRYLRETNGNAQMPFHLLNDKAFMFSRDHDVNKQTNNQLFNFMKSLRKFHGLAQCRCKTSRSCSADCLFGLSNV